MAALTANQLTELRHAARRNIAQAGTKPQINAALQAIEDRMLSTATRNAIQADIEAAAPGVFTNGEKNTLFGVWCVTAANRLGVL